MKPFYSILALLGGTTLFIGVLLWIAKPSGSGSATASSPSQTTLAAEETSYDFGNVSMANGVVTHTYRVRNGGTAPVRLTKLTTSCMCTKATLVQNGNRTGPFGMPGHGFVPGLNETVQPGETVTVDVAFDPAAHGPSGVGPVARAVYLENDAGAPLELSFKAVVTP